MKKIIFAILVLGTAGVFASSPTVFRDLLVRTSLKFSSGAGTAGKALTSSDTAGSVQWATLGTIGGGTGVTSVTTSPTASSFAGWDASKIIYASIFAPQVTSTATAGTTTTLTVASTQYQYFTGSTTQTVTLPVVAAITNGVSFRITNLSSGVVTVQSSGGNTLQAMAAGTELNATIRDNTGGTGTASWSWLYSGGGGVTTMAAVGSSANANGATISGTALNLEPASASFPGVVTTGSQTIAGSKTFSGATIFSNSSAISLSGASPVIAGSAGVTQINMNGGNMSLSGTNTAGGLVYINSGLGTGTGLGGIYFSVPGLKPSGTTAQDSLSLALSVVNDASTTTKVAVWNSLNTPEICDESGINCHDMSSGWSTTAVNMRNYARNAGFRFAQRFTPGTPTTFTDATYGPDGWYALSEGATGVSFQRIADATPTGSRSPFYVTLLQKTAASNRFGLAQKLETANVKSLRGKTVTFAFQAAGIAGTITTLRACIGEWTGTADTVTTDVVSSWGSTPTWIGSFSCVNTPADLTISSSWAQQSITATLGTSFNNLVLVVWTPNQEAQNDDFSITQVQLVEGSAPLTWSYIELPQDRDRAECQRYYAKTFGLDTAPVQNVGSLASALRTQTTSGGSWYATAHWTLPVRMRAAPTVTTYNPGATNANFRNGADSADYTKATPVIDSATVDIDTTNSVISSDNGFIHATANAEL